MGVAGTNGTGTGNRVRVLLVEGDAGEAKRTRRALEQSESPPVAVVHVATLQQALAALHEAQTDVIVTEAPVDGAGGATLLHALAASHDLPVIVFSSSDEPGLDVRMIELGADDFVAKADGPRALARSVRAAVARDRWARGARALIESTADAMVLTDADRFIRFVNQAAEDLFRRSADDLVGELFGYQVGSPVAEIDVPTAGGSITAEMRTRSLRWAGGPAYLSVIRDINDRKRAEDYWRQLAHADRLASIGQLAAGVAHEVNNPAAFVAANLFVLSQYLDEFRDASTDAGGDRGHRLRVLLEESQQMLHECEEGINRIASTVRDLRSFARIERGDLELVDLNQLIGVACTMTRNEIRYRAELETEFGELPLVKGDRGKLSQVLVNLLLNASQAFADDSDRAKRIAVRSWADGDLVKVEIEDTGEGIPPERLRSIFEPFFTTKERSMGTGLGLAICSETVQMHEGTIEVDSEVGRGSRFVISLPAADPAEIGGVVEATLAAPAEMPVRALVARGRILVIDDDPHLRRALKRLLRDYQVVDCPGGREALELLDQDDRFDAVLCDMMMPIMDGVGVFEALELRYPALASRTVFMTGGAFTPRTKEFLLRCPRPVLSKPIATPSLVAAFDQVMID